MALISTMVGILMASYNGERYLGVQLDSIAAQTERRWFLLVSDDGSSDETLIILRRFQSRFPEQVKIVRGPGQGAAQNFIHLARIASQVVSSPYWAFCDQDDVWDEDRLAKALALIDAGETSLIALYCSRVRYVDEHGSPLSLSPKVNYEPSLGSALIMNLASGNTMVFSDEARLLLAKASSSRVHHHDWFLYLLVCASGGSVIYDARPGVLYRQHTENVLGPMVGLGAYLGRLRIILSGRYRTWRRENVTAALSVCEHFERDISDKLVAVQSSFESHWLHRVHWMSRCRTNGGRSFGAWLLIFMIFLGRG